MKTSMPCGTDGAVDPSAPPAVIAFQAGDPGLGAGRHFTNFVKLRARWIFWRPAPGLPRPE